jgi:hypothetical protein
VEDMRTKMLGFVGAVAAATSLTIRPLLSAEPQFRFQNNIWVNLHHFLRGEARRRSLGQPPALALSGLHEADRAAWTAALDAYGDFAKRNLIFDERLVRINNALASQEDADALPASLVEPGALTALNRASSIYRKSMWAAHRRMNDEWIGRVRPLVEQHAPALIQALTDAYHVRWPTGPIIVEASNDAGPNLAYTTDGPEGAAAHTTIASTKDAEIDVAFETVFHEASHSVDSQIMRFVDEEGAKQRVKPPPDLWHGIIFFTVGELVKRELHRGQRPAASPTRTGLVCTTGDGKTSVWPSSGTGSHI